MKLFAKILSYLFHPVVLASILPFIIVYRVRESSLYALKWTLFSSVFIALVMLLIFFGKRKGIFSDQDISKREERYHFYEILYFLVFVYFAAAVFLKGIFFPLSIIAFGVMIGIVLFNFVNHFIKASIHTAVACAYAITVGIIYGPGAFLIAFWIIPLISWSRIYLKRHTVSEAITGGVLGSSITLLTYFIGSKVL